MEAAKQLPEAEKTYRLFDPNIGAPSPETIKKMGYYPMLMTLKILDKSLTKALAEHEEKFIEEIANSFLSENKIILNFIDIKDKESVKNAFKEALKKTVKEKTLEFNESKLKSMGFYPIDKFSPEKKQMIKLARRFCRLVIEDEELLNMCVILKNKAEQMALCEKIIRRAAEKYNISINDQQIENFIAFLDCTSPSCKEFNAIINYHDFYDPYNDNAYNKTLYSIICEYADAYFQTAYLLRQFEWMKRFIQTFFPKIFREFNFVTCLEYYPRYVLKDFKNSIYGQVAFENASIAFFKTWLIKIQTAHPISGCRNFENMETTFPWVSNPQVANYKFLRIINDFVDFVHEYAHGVFSVITEKTEIAKSCKETVEKWDKTAHVVLSEGWAVLVETLAVDFIIAHADTLGLSEREKKDFIIYRQIRIFSNKDKETAKRESAKDLEMLLNPWLRAQYLRDIAIEMETLSDETLREGYKEYLRKIIGQSADPEEKKRLFMEIFLCDNPEARQARTEYLQDDRVEVFCSKLREERIKRNQDFLNFGTQLMYIEGYFFFKTIYEEYGLDKTFEFIEKIKEEKVFYLQRDSEEYKKLIKDPLKLAKYLTT